MKNYALIIISLFSLSIPSYSALTEHTTNSRDYDFFCFQNKLYISHEKLEYKVKIEQTSKDKCRELLISLLEEQANSLNIKLSVSSTIISRETDYRDRGYYPYGRSACRTSSRGGGSVQVCYERQEFDLYKARYDIIIEGFATSRLQTSFSKSKESFVRSHGEFCRSERCSR